jgi:hypothetical protein
MARRKSAGLNGPPPTMEGKLMNGLAFVVMFAGAPEGTAATGAGMNPWTCASLIAIAGGLGGVVNALLTDNGFILPSRMRNIWCPGFLSNILIGAFSAFSSWAFYGSGASVELTQLNERALISLKFSALAGAFLVGVAGARWITNEVDKKLLKETVKEAAAKQVSPRECEQILAAPARAALRSMEQV